MNPRDLLFAFSMLLVMIGMARNVVAFAEDQGAPPSSVAQAQQIGKRVSSKHLASGALSHGESGRDGSVAASRTVPAGSALE